MRAIQPAIAEEAWGRVLMIPLLFFLFSRSARAGMALWAAVLVGIFWFAWLHTPLNPVATLLLGGLFVLPMAVLWLRRDLETAIGYHCAADALRFIAAFLFASGVWFR